MKSVVLDYTIIHRNLCLNNVTPTKRICTLFNPNSTTKFYD